MPAYDPRAVKGVGVTYATTPMGADHTAGYAVATNILGLGGKVDPLKPEARWSSPQPSDRHRRPGLHGLLHHSWPSASWTSETFQALIEHPQRLHRSQNDRRRRGGPGQERPEAGAGIQRRRGFTPAPGPPPPRMYMRANFLPPHNTTFDVSDGLDSVFNF